MLRSQVTAEGHRASVWQNAGTVKLRLPIHPPARRPSVRYWFSQKGPAWDGRAVQRQTGPCWGTGSQDYAWWRVVQAFKHKVICIVKKVQIKLRSEEGDTTSQRRVMEASQKRSAWKEGCDSHVERAGWRMEKVSQFHSGTSGRCGVW